MFPELCEEAVPDEEHHDPDVLHLQVPRLPVHPPDPHLLQVLLESFQKQVLVLEVEDLGDEVLDEEDVLRVLAVRVQSGGEHWNKHRELAV